MHPFPGFGMWRTKTPSQTDRRLLCSGLHTLYDSNETKEEKQRKLGALHCLVWTGKKGLPSILSLHLNIVWSGPQSEWVSEEWEYKKLDERNHRNKLPAQKIYIWLNAHKQDSLDPKFVFFSPMPWPELLLLLSSCRVVCHSQKIATKFISLCLCTYHCLLLQLLIADATDSRLSMELRLNGIASHRLRVNRFNSIMSITIAIDFFFFFCINSHFG